MRGARIFGDLGTDDVNRLKPLDQEISRLRKLVLECALKIEVMKAIAEKVWLAYRRNWARCDSATCLYADGS